jgi:hypothetical protein
MHPSASQPFSSPSAGDICKPLDVIGHLLLVRPIEFLPDFPTSNGARDAVRVDICDLSVNDESGQWGAVYRDALWFGRVLVSGLRRQIGELVLARMAQGIAKPGQNPPFNLVDMVSDARAVAAGQSWIAQHPEFGNGHASSSPAPAPVSAPVVTPTQAPYPPMPQQQYAPGPVPAYGPPQAVTGPVPPAPVPPYPTHQAPPNAQPGYGPVPVAGANPQPNNPTSAAPAADPNVDPYTLLSPEQRAALEAIGFRRP